VIEEQHKFEMNAAGNYVAPGQQINAEGVVTGAPPLSTTISFWVSGLASPFVPFGERAGRYVEALQSGDPEEVQTVINGGFGELWAVSGGDAPEWMEVSRKSTDSIYRRGELPAGVVYLTMTVDVQKNRLVWVIRGWGARATSWLIDGGELMGETIEAEVWNDLAHLLTTPVGDLPIKLALIDSGFRPGKPHELPLNRVYEFCRRFKRLVRPTKGSSSPMRVPLIVSKQEVTPKGKAAKYGLELIRLDTDHWKSWVHERVRWPNDQLGAWHLPIDISDDYCMQVVSEARVRRPSGGVSWVQKSRANHFLDCEAMQAAAGYLLNVQRMSAEQAAGLAPGKPLVGYDGNTLDQSPALLPAAAPPVVARRRVFRSSYV
jgi:phage terminase large subunit GpA-like protein